MIYIGQTVKNIHKRKREHEWAARNRPFGTFAKALLDCGFENFKWEILEENLSVEIGNEKEMFYIELHNSTDPTCGYNILRGGNNRPERKVNRLHCKHKEETKLKMSKTHILLNKKLSQETKDKISEKNKGRILTEETKTKMSKSKSKRVLDTATGKIFTSLEEAAKYNKLNASYLSTKLSGKRKNNTNLIYV